MPTAFVPLPILPQTTRIINLNPPRLAHTSNSDQSTISRRRLLSTALTIPLTTIFPPPSHASPIETDKVFMDISVAGKPAGRIVIALYGQEAPVSVDTFTKLTKGTLSNRAGNTAGFKYSQAAKVVKGKFVNLGHIKQIDSLNQQPGLAQRQILSVELPENRDDNHLHHDAAGLVSVRRGGSFEFSVMLAPDLAMDEQNLVVGRVIHGMDIVERLGKVPTNKKKVPDAYRSIGKVIGDARAKVDVRAIYCCHLHMFHIIL